MWEDGDGWMEYVGLPAEAVEKGMLEDEILREPGSGACCVVCGWEAGGGCVVCGWDGGGGGRAVF